MVFFYFVFFRVYFTSLFFQVFCFFALFSESLFCSLLNVLSFAIAKFIKVFYWFLLEFARLLMLFRLVIHWIFRERLLSHHHLVVIRLERNMKIAFQVESSLSQCCAHLRKYMLIEKMKNVFESRQVLLKHSKILFSLVDKSTNYLKHLRLSNISTTEINEFLLVADVPIKF